ncbi:unnamed protein product [Urochloa decumbens]|uniref:KIB1-4 beta-propeller domain-containing protein n=1 Tax=Urochloa decumbens TaxID=240449 RepID=A0ABC9DVH5_9POAL
MAAIQSSSWSDLQPELLGLVLQRLPSLADRVRLRAVCRTWQYNARLQSLPPPLPWLSLLDGTFLSFPSGEIHRMPVPDEACCHGSIDNWLFLMNNDGWCSLMNPFSKAMLQLPKLPTIGHEMDNPCPLFYKLVVPSFLDLSPESLVAVLIMDGGFDSTLCICQPPISTDAISRLSGDKIYDVVFFSGKLYALTPVKLFLLEIADNHKCKPKISSIKCIIDSVDYPSMIDRLTPNSYLYARWNYLVESGGRLLLVARRIGVLLPLPEHNMLQHARTLYFEVFEADLTTDSCCRWRRVSSLAGQALFVGTCSKSLPAAECGLPQEDCIYFTCDYARARPAPDPLRDSGVFNMRNGTIAPLLPETRVVRRVGERCPTWFFPSEVM